MKINIIIKFNNGKDNIFEREVFYEKDFNDFIKILRTFIHGNRLYDPVKFEMETIDNLKEQFNNEFEDLYKDTLAGDDYG